MLMNRNPKLHFSILLDVIWTTPTDVLGVLPVIVIFGLREYSKYCYTTFVGVLPQKWYSPTGSTPARLKKGHWEYTPTRVV